MTLKKIMDKLRKKEISAVELTEYYLKRIKRLDNILNSYITVCEESAIETAKQAQTMIDRGEGGALTGVPLSVKDNICVEGIRATCASKMLADFVPPYSASAVERLKSAGAVILGKTNMDEFAMGNSSRTSYFGAVKNPYDISRCSGGSSGGAAVAVAANLCAAALGTDTGGSVRQPASFCGVTGLKPTYGKVSRWGLIAFASSLDQIGVIAKSAEDCGIVLSCISGGDRYDMTAKDCTDNGQQCRAAEITVGLPKEFFADGIDEDVKTAVLNAAEYYKRMGCAVKTVSLPSLAYAVPAYYLISSAEAASNLARYDGIRFGYRSKNGADFDSIVKNTRREGFGKEVKRRIMLGNYALSAGYYDDYYKTAMRIRERIRHEYNEIFKECDVILTPTAPKTAPKVDAAQGNPAKQYLEDIYTVTASIAGLPAISTVCGYGSDGMPIGMSLTGRALDEKTIINVCGLFERGFERREAAL